MRRIQVESEISATSYKKLIKRLRGLNRKSLLAIFDHYIVHVITDENVAELLSILDEIERTNTPITAEVSPFDNAGFELPEKTFDEEIVKLEYLRPKFPDMLTPEDLESNRNRLDLMFDEGYFDYLIPSEKDTKGLAQKLIDFSEQNDLPVEDHWRRYAGVEE